jgi:hypothetical protein
MTRYTPPIPEELLDERVLPISTVAQLVSQTPKKTLELAKEGRFGPCCA